MDNSDERKKEVFEKFRKGFIEQKFTGAEFMKVLEIITAKRMADLDLKPEEIELMGMIQSIIMTSHLIDNRNKAKLALASIIKVATVKGVEPSDIFELFIILIGMMGATFGVLTGPELPRYREKYKNKLSPESIDRWLNENIKVVSMESMDDDSDCDEDKCSECEYKQECDDFHKAMDEMSASDVTPGSDTGIKDGDKLH